MDLPIELARLIDRVFVPRNPNKMRNATLEVVEAAREFKRRLQEAEIAEREGYQMFAIPQFDLCEETGQLAVGGACPVHQGDACLRLFVPFGNLAQRIDALEAALRGLYLFMQAPHKERGPADVNRVVGLVHDVLPSMVEANQAELRRLRQRPVDR